MEQRPARRWVSRRTELPTPLTASSRSSASSVYLGNGATADIVGSIDGILNGADGTTLRVNFTSDFQNAGFETGDLTGWTAIDRSDRPGIDDDRRLPQPSTPAPTRVRCPTRTTTSRSSWVLSPPLLSRMWSPKEPTPSNSSPTTCITLQGYDVVHGPAVYSGPFEAASGDTIYFDWRAYAGEDDYHVFGYIIDESCNQTELLDATGGGNTAVGHQPDRDPGFRHLPIRVRVRHIRCVRRPGRRRLALHRQRPGVWQQGERCGGSGSCPQDHLHEHGRGITVQPDPQRDRPEHRRFFQRSADDQCADRSGHHHRGDRHRRQHEGRHQLGRTRRRLVPHHRLRHPILRRQRSNVAYIR